MKKLLISLALIACAAIPAAVWAHQPRIVSDDKIVEINNPEISQAFYGFLDGEPARFRITSSAAFKLYANLLVPDLNGVGRDLSAEIKYASPDGRETASYLIDGRNFQWTKFHEEFANDDYWQGPELTKDAAPAGTYDIQVRRPGNVGRYVLVIGQIESFPPSEALNSIWTIPQLKASFFDKPFYLAFWNIIGAFLFGAVVVLAVAIVIVWKIIKRIRRRRQ